MSGYFKSLMKQSGVNIDARNSSALGRGDAAHRGAPDPVTPLHVDTVAVAGPTTGEVERVEGKPTLTKPAYEVSEQATVRDPISDVTTNKSPVISNHTIDARSETKAPRQPEPGVAQETSVTPQTKPETTSEAPVSINEVIESRKTTPGVIRVGEIENDIDQPSTVESNTRAFDRSESSIPPEYLEGIREWLTAPPTKNDEISIDQHDDSDPIVLKPAERSRRPAIELDVASQEELQEFSLSIGSISIVVEEPARQPPPPITNTQPVEHAPANAQPRARDAFALNRNYFRGF